MVVRRAGVKSVHLPAGDRRAIGPKPDGLPKAD